MKALLKLKNGPGASIEQVDIPAIEANEVLVKVQAASICGTDYHIYKWDHWAASRIKPPLIIGHEMAGEIIQVGPMVSACQVGDYVSLECHKACGHCYQCHTGQAHICTNYTIQGVDFNGCFAEYVAVPETSVWKNDRKMAPEIACLQDPIGNAVMAVLSTAITGKTVLISGCGAIGLFAVGLAKVSGASKVYAVEVNPYRLDLAAKMGASLCLNPLQDNVVEKIYRDNKGCGVDIIVEMSGNESALHTGLEIVKNGGRVALLGIPEDPVSLDLAKEIIFKGVTITGITGREIFDTWYKTSALLGGVLDVSPVITHKYKMTDYESAFAVMQTGECGKIILYP